MWDEVVVQEVSVDKSAGVTQTGRDVEENDDEEVLYRGLSLRNNSQRSVHALLGQSQWTVSVGVVCGNWVVGVQDGGLNKNKQKEVEFCVLPSLTKRTFPPPCVMGLGPPCVVRKKK